MNIKHSDARGRGVSVSFSGDVVPVGSDKSPVIDLQLGKADFKPDIFKELKDLKRHNIVGKTMEESKTGHYVSYDDVLRLFHKYWGK